MLRVQPFCGLRYNLSRITDLQDVVCPPYDIISTEDQQSYLRRSPHNIVRLELAEELPSDNERNNKYTRSAALLKDWMEESILVREEGPAFYITEHRFTYRGETRSRWGLTAAVGVQEWSTRNIRPHEAILKEPAADRLNLMRACQINFSPVIGMLNFEHGELVSLLPQLAANSELLSVSADGVTDNTWILRDHQGIAQLTKLCADRIIYILDGHHRYQTALTYSKENHAAGSVMINIVDSSDPALIMFPTHRLVQLPAERLRGLPQVLADLVDLERILRYPGTIEEVIKKWATAMEEKAREGWAVGAYGLWGSDLGLLSAPRRPSLMERMPQEHSEAWKRLDVSLLHSVILSRVMGLGGPTTESDLLKYTRDPIEAINRVDTGEFQLAFMLNAIPTSSVMAVADAGDRMPQKSTYLHPKPRTGLVMNPLWKD